MSRVYEEVDPAYAVACSDVTLCSNSKGFFRGLCDDLISVADSDGWLQNFELEPDDKKLSAVLEHKQITEALSEVFSRIQPLYRGKDGRISVERRSAAQTAVKEGDLNKALALAHQAVLRAPITGMEEDREGGVTLALALWQRAEVLMLNGRARAALADLQLAHKERLPARMRGQYYWRMGKCYRDIGDPSRAKVSFELAGRLIGADEAAKAELNKDLETLDYSTQPKHLPKKSGITLTGGAHQNIPALSKHVTITKDEEKGRFAVANNDIKTGDVLLVDSPYAACLLSDFYGTHCLHCFKRLETCEEEAPVWCPNCSGVAFCSSQCRDTAVNSYHAYECPFVDLFIGSGMSILSHIALRMVTQAGLDTSMSIHADHVSNKTTTGDCLTLNDIDSITKSKMKSRKDRLRRTRKGLKSNNEDGTELHEETKYKSLAEESVHKASQIYSLCTHSNLRKGSDCLKRIVMAMFLTECLKKAGFFYDCKTDDFENVSTAICELLIRNLQLLQFNAHEVYETVCTRHQVSGSKPIYVAVAIYPTAALFNHECYPSVARYFEGRKIVLRATRPLSPGDVVSENYGPHFMVRTLKERQRSCASRYWFRCHCIACKEDWPMLKQMKSETPFLRCPNPSCTGKFVANKHSVQTRCGKCSTNIDREYMKVNLDTVDQCVSMYQEGAQLMEEEKANEAISTICSGIDLFHEVARPPHRDTHVAQEALRSCFAVFGNVHVVKSENTDARLGGGTAVPSD